MGYLAAVLVTGMATALCSYASRILDHSNLIMIYLLSIVYIATRFGRGPSILASILGVFEFDYFCVPPHFSFAVADTQYIISLTVMITIIILITTLTSEVQAQAEVGRSREKRSEALRALTTDMSLLRGRDRLVEVAMRHIRTFFDAMVGIYLPDASGKLNEYTADLGLIKLDRPISEMAGWAFQHREACGLGRATFSESASLYLPLVASQGVVGVLQVSPRGESRMSLAEDQELLETFARQTALCIEVATLSERTQIANIQIEREQLRNALLSSVSHDLRTPLATITGASSSLVEDKASLNDSQKQELAEVILEEAEHLNNHVRNLLEMTKLESGALSLKRNWVSIEETVGACLTRLERHLKKRQIQINIPIDLPLVPFDEILIQQVFLNLLENALKYSPEGSPIDIAAELEPASGESKLEWVKIRVADRGQGLKEGEEEKIFIKFYRSAATSSHMGVGLGLSICHAIVKAHGGTISAANREGGGAEFTVRLRLDGTQPLSIIELDFENKEIASSEISGEISSEKTGENADPNSEEPTPGKQST